MQPLNTAYTWYIEKHKYVMLKANVGEPIVRI